jgi:hypothetical protein
MIQFVDAIDFVQVASGGRNEPLILQCQRADNSFIDVFAKFSAYCDEGVTNLGREVISALLGADLGLPVVEPVFVRTTPQWLSALPDSARATRLAGACPLAFGSVRAGAGFALWRPTSAIPDVMRQQAAEVFAFDALIQNIDRTPKKPNCLVRLTELRVIDHEAAFAHYLPIIGQPWIPPWKIGGADYLARPGAHVFFQGLRGKSLDLSRFRDAWRGLNDATIDSYSIVMPPQWAAGTANFGHAIRLIKDVRDNIDLCITEIGRVLT